MRRIANSHGLIAAAAKRVEVPERAQIAFLHGVVGIGRVAQQIARERVDLVEMRQRGVAKPPRPVRIVAVTGHRLALRAACPHGRRRREHHCAAPLPVAASTTIVPVMCGCKEQK